LIVRSKSQDRQTIGLRIEGEKHRKSLIVGRSEWWQKKALYAPVWQHRLSVIASLMRARSSSPSAFMPTFNVGVIGASGIRKTSLRG
jgi:hypothetical protein